MFLFGGGAKEGGTSDNHPASPRAEGNLYETEHTQTLSNGSGLLASWELRLTSA